MTEVAAGQVWRDKDKRRNTAVRIESVNPLEVTARVVGTTEVRTYGLARFAHRWKMSSDVRKKQGVYMLKMACNQDPTYFLRMTQTKIDNWGAPLCPCHHEAMIEA
jgi:hypothetical protein|tara:strand:+ start:30836 stop:31153 length:318 start_codon:yes stop_codon:yes gene_type:complete